MGYTLFERGTGRTWWPTLSKNGVTYLSTENGWEAQGKDTHPYMPDISDAPAFMVRELFDTAYSKVLGALEAGE